MIKTDRVLAVVVLTFAAVVVLVGVLFGRLIANYQDNTMKESAAHLIEINQELKLYVEAKIEGDWNATYSIANSVASGKLETDKEMLDYITKERDIWEVSNITLYTASGFTVSTDGSVMDNDEASATISNVIRNGEYLTVVESTLIFVAPAETEAEYNGSRIVAVSVVQDLSSFLDNMNISAFGGEGYLYLTQDNGAVISRQTHDGQGSVYNLMPLLLNDALKPITGDENSVEDMLKSQGCAVFLRKTDGGDQYMVTSKIETGHEDMRLFYFVPVSVVDKTADSFSHYILMLSIIVISAFASGAVIVFINIYNARKRQFNKALAAREDMLELLVENSKSAFALLTIDQEEPRFRSGNGKRIIGESFYNLEKTDEGFKMKGSAETETEEIKAINEQMKDWDGKSEFRSAFIRNTTSAVPVYFEIQIFPLVKNGQKGDYIAIAQDVTPLYERQAATTEALAMAEQANQAKTRFLSSMSHDIRTPMNAIVNMTDFAIESAGEPEKQLEYLNSLRESSAHLLRLINDVLDMSRIESGRLVVAAEPFELKAELERIVGIARPLCEEKKQSFNVDFSGVKEDTVLGDQVKLSQILMNLLSNACKFTPEGGSVSFYADDLLSLKENVANIRFVVEDTGMGMSDEEMKTIFEPFTRAGNDRVGKIEGTGLGLSICRSYVNAMGGAISCESEEGRGSRFTVELFFGAAKTEIARNTQTETEGVTFEGKRCLLCEDNMINRVIADKILRKLGFEVESASDGKEGVEKFAASPEGYYDVIYMDVQMPVMDGYRAAETIRKCAHKQAKTVPIIAMTANVFAEDIEKARAAGMNGHLGKPIIVAELVETTAKILKSENER